MAAVAANENRSELAEADCRHCGLPVPAGRLARGSGFCCAGCHRVHELIVGSGLERYYELRDGSTAPPPQLSSASLSWLERELERLGGDRTGPRRILVDVQGIHCAACVWLLRELFLRRPGAVDLVVNPARGQAELVWDPSRLDLADYLAEVERFGYRFGPHRDRPGSALDALMVRLGISAAAAMNVMIFSFCFYAGLGPEDGSLYLLFGRLSLALTLVAAAVGGWVFVRAAAAGLRSGVVHLDLPIAVGLVLATAGSVWAYVARGPEGAYFDTVAVFATLMLTGRVLQERVLERNRNALLVAEGAEHLLTRRVREGRLEPVPVVAVDPGDELCVVPGDVVPVESTLLGDPGLVALDWITGESEVRELAPGDTVPAGASNAGRSPMRLGALEGFATSRLARLLESPPSGGRPAGSAGFWWRRVGALWVAGVLACAGAGLLLWLPAGLEPALEVTVAILVVTCPCALGLGVPLTHELAHAALRRRGVFLRDGTFLDRALDVRKVLFDKTGTLTSGRLDLLEPGRGVLRKMPASTRRALHDMVARSNHPASRSLLAELESLGESGGEALGVVLEEHPGQGLQLERDGHTYWLGRPAFAAPGPAADPDATCLAVDGRVVASFTFAEEVKEDVAAEVAALEGGGREVFLLSGDRTDKVLAAARAIGLDPARCAAELGPEEKAERVRALDRGDTFMVGDGLNDAASFAVAHCTATPAVDRPSLPAAADLYFLGAGVAAVRQSLAVAARVRRVVRANLAFAVLYNAVALALCFAGVVRPLVAAVLMPASSLLVVAHTVARLRAGRAAWTS